LSQNISDIFTEIPFQLNHRYRTLLPLLQILFQSTIISDLKR